MTFDLINGEPQTDQANFSMIPNTEASKATSISSNQPKLEVRSLYKTFSAQGKQLIALENINLQIYPEEFVSLVGPSGCGKSTLLNIVAGLTLPSSGQVLVDGEVVPGPGADRGMVFQTYTLFPWLCVADNISFGLKLRRLPRREIQQLVAYYLDVIGLTKFARAYPKQLSGGMKQRVAIARALAIRPQVLILDEPFGALDALTRIEMQGLIESLWQQHHFTVLLVTHDVSEAVAMADRVLLIEEGEIGLDLLVDLPRPRRRGSARLAELEAEVLDRVMQRTERPQPVRYAQQR